jgi:serine/threonine protein kinase
VKTSPNDHPSFSLQPSAFVLSGGLLAGRYSLQSPFGERVDLWLAQDEIEDRPVLLRFLSVEVREDPRAMQELSRQVALCRGLDHPHLGAVHELVQEPDAPAFLVLGYAEGRTLDSLQREQPQGVLTWEWLEPRARQLCEALHHAHERQIVHGGVHPENIVINRLGDVSLLHCGVSTVLNHPLYSGTASQDHLGYFSSQLLEGRAPALPDDVYATGVVLYQALSGTAPFRGSDLLSQIRNLPPASLEARLQELKIVNPVPVPVSRFILSALSRNPEVRPVDLRDLPGLSAPSTAEEAAARLAGPEPVPGEVSLPQPPVEGATESLTSGGEDQLEEVRRMRAAIQRDQRRRLVIGFSILGLALAVASYWLVPWALQNLRARRTIPTVPTPHATLANSASPAPQPSQPSAASPPPAPKPAAPAAPPAPAPADPEQGFESLFNGRDLTGWTGDPRHWLARDGLIIGRGLPDSPLKSHTCLVCEQGTVEDFELRFSFRCLAYKYNEQPNAGVEYRAARPDGTRLRGYQYEIVRDPKGVGAVMDDQGRGLLASEGAQVEAGTEGGKDFLKTVGAAASSNAVATAFQREDWNEGVVLARGNHLIHKLNGLVVADVVDLNRDKRHTSGLLALEIYFRNTNNPATFVLFKNVRLKTFRPGGR